MFVLADLALTDDAVLPEGRHSVIAVAASTELTPAAEDWVDCAMAACQPWGFPAALVRELTREPVAGSQVALDFEGRWFRAREARDAGEEARSVHLGGGG
jgi:hypothetical protein